MRAVKPAPGRTRREGRAGVWQFAGRYGVWIRNWAPPRLSRSSALPLCDGFALAVAVLLMPEWAAVGYALAVLVLLNAGGAQRLRICLRISDEIPRLAAFAVLPIVLFLPWTERPVRLAALSLTSIALLLTMRVGLYATLRAGHRRGRLTEPTLIVGTGQAGVEVGKTLSEHPDLGLRPVGLIGPPDQEPEPRLPVLGGLSEMPAVVAQWDVRMIIVCCGDRVGADLVTALRANRPLGAEICVVPRWYELAAAIPAGSRDDLWGIPLIPLRPGGPLRPGQVVKRAFDIVVGTTLLIAFAPLLLLMVIAMAVCDGRPVFFRQERVTRGGARMKITKLRTVTTQNPDDQWNVSPDECTRLGRLLRATHIDELPQLVNVIRGQMSLVGPRPERPHYTAQFAAMIPRYDDRHRVHGGMTGWAQVHGLQGDTSIPDRIRFDNYYIENWSLWLDMTILARTLAEPLTGVLKDHEP